LAELLAWNFPPTMRLAKLDRGANLIWSITCADPRSSPAQAPLPVGASKKVVRLPSNTLAMVLPWLFHEPDVPMIAPANLADVTATIVTLAVPLTAPLAARTVADPAVAGAVYRPELLTEPVPLAIDHVNVGWVVSAAPNWSFAVAVNCCVALVLIDADAGLTAMLVSVWLTVTLTLLVVVSPPLSLIVTWKLYVPALVNVALELFDALVPLLPKVTAAGGDPVVAHV